MTLPNSFASLSPDHNFFAFGGANLSSPMGGSANGMPRKAKTGFSEFLANTCFPQTEADDDNETIGFISVV